MSIAQHWGSTAEEREARYPCDQVLPQAPSRLTRAVDADADVPTLFRRLEQIRVAPYSYDLIDNLGRRSPRALLPRQPLETGQRWMSIFTLIAFTPDEHLTFRINPGLAARAYGDIALTYWVAPMPNGSRLLSVLRAMDAPGPLGGVRRKALEWGDFVMMRKQLLTLAELAAGDKPTA